MIVNQISATAPCTRGARTTFLPALAKSRGETSKCAYAHLWEKRVSALTMLLNGFGAIGVPAKENPPCSPDQTGIQG